MFKGKGAMVWVLRNWQQGDAFAQAAHAQELGLDYVLIKGVNGLNERWERVGTARQNADLLPGAISALVAAGIEAAVWGYEYGRGSYPPFPSIAAREGEAAARILRKCMDVGASAKFVVDAEREWREAYRRLGQGSGLNMQAEVDRWMTGFRSAAPAGVELGLCSFRFPSAQPDFAWNWLRHVQAHLPQVYWWGDDRVDGGALQLEQSHRELQAMRQLPMIPVGSFKWDGHPWRTTPEQIARFLARAKSLGCPGAAMYTLDAGGDGSLPEQMAALQDFRWEIPETRAWADATPAEKDGVLLELAKRGALVDARGMLVT